MKSCALCGKNIEIDKYFSRKATCPHCGGDLHICLNCTFYSESSHNKCRESKAEFQRIRDRAHFCDYFVFSDAGPSSSCGKREDTLKKLEDLFKKKE